MRDAQRRDPVADAGRLDALGVPLVCSCQQLRLQGQQFVGAGFRHQLRYLIIPMMKPIILFTVIIATGVTGGEEVVTEGQLRLTPGTRITTAPTAEATS